MFYREINPDRVLKVDIVVGIPSYNEANLISIPTQQASLGLVQFFGDKKSVIINCDNNSEDGTKDAFLSTPTEVPKIYISTPPGVKGKGYNLMNLFRKVCELNAKACIVVDANLKSITPRWIKNLGEPLFKNFGFVAPLYVRHKYDGILTNNLVYPLIRALYGRRVRQPMGGEFGFSDHMVDIFSKSEDLNETISQFGIDIWMCTMAIANNVPICQSYMGRPKVHKPKDPEEGLGETFFHVIRTIFEMMISLRKIWKGKIWSKPTAIMGFELGEAEPPQPKDININEEKLYQSFVNSFDKYQGVWKALLSYENFSKLLEVLSLHQGNLEFPVQLWAHIIYDYAVAYKRNEIDRRDLIDSLLPIFHGKVFSFLRKTQAMSIQQIEEYIEDQCLIFEETKPYLEKRWE
jgi:glycosyltransferase involved in cell wall biosynthesis